MRKGLKAEKGAAAILILVILLIVCLLLPVFAFSIDRLAAQNNFDKIQDTISISVTSAYMALMPQFYTDAIVKLDPDLFSEKFNALLIANLAYEYPGIEIAEEQIFSDGLPVVCLRGNVFNLAGVHILVKVPVRHSISRMLIPKNEKHYEWITVHSDVLFTLDN